MKLFASPKHFSEATAMLTTLSCLLGLRVFDYPRGRSRPILSLIYLLFLYILCCNGTLRIQEEYYANLKLMKLEYVLYKLMMYLFIVSVIIKMLLGWWYTKKFKVCHKKIFEIDETLRQLGLRVNYERIYFATIGILTAWITFTLTVCTVIFIHLQINTDIFTAVYLVLEFTYSVTVNSISVFEFNMFARYLKMKFELVNQLLRESLTDPSIKEIKLGIFEMKDFCKIITAEQQKQVLSTRMILRRRQRKQSRRNVSVSGKQDPGISHVESHFPSQVKEQLQSVPQNPSGRHSSATKCQRRKHLLQVIKQVHLELCKVTKIVCTILGVQIAWEIGVIIIFLTGAVYNFYVRYIINQHRSLVGETFVLLTLCLIHIIKVISLIYVSRIAAEEGNRTIEIIRAIYDCDTDADMQEEIQQFGLQILQSPVTFSVYGLTLDNRVLSMVLKTVTIYMVIMAQVSNTLESNNAIKSAQFKEL